MTDYYGYGYYENSGVAEDEFVEEDTMGSYPLGVWLWPAAPLLGGISGILNYMEYSDASQGVADYWKPIVMLELFEFPLIAGWLFHETYYYGVGADILLHLVNIGLVFRANSNLPNNDGGVMSSLILHTLGLGFNGFAIFADLTYDWCNNGHPEECEDGDYYGDDASGDYGYYGYYGYY